MEILDDMKFQVKTYLSVRKKKKERFQVKTYGTHLRLCFGDRDLDLE